MKKLLLAVFALGLLVISDAVSSIAWRRATLAISLCLSVSILVHGVVRRRRSGQSWNQALAGDTKLMTGSVWLDGLLFGVILLLCIAGVVAVFFLL